MLHEASGGGRCAAVRVVCPVRVPDLARPTTAQDKLEPSEALGDLLSRAGDHDAALGMYQRANVPGKVIEGLAAKGDFDALSKFRCARVALPPHLKRGACLPSAKWLGLPMPPRT